jgi:hypothetical protein
MTPQSPKQTDLREARISQYAIGQKLRQLFDEVAREPTPDEFLEILRRADHREGKDPQDPR